jgi:hypothetical protein
MAGQDPKRGRRTHATNLCRHFDGTELATCARPGLEALETDHKPVVRGGNSIGCGVALDRCRRIREPNAARWDYVFIARDTDHGVAIEVHHTDANEVDRMIAKKQWAETVIAEHCPRVHVLGWIWIASPPTSQIFILPQSPNARRLAEAKIRFPQVAVTLP